VKKGSWELSARPADR